MKHIIKAAAPLAVMFAVAFGSASAQQQPTTPGAKAQAPDCARLWTTADANKDGNLAGDELRTYVSAMTAIDTDKDGKVSKVEFETACKANKLPQSG